MEQAEEGPGLRRPAMQAPAGAGLRPEASPFTDLGRVSSSVKQGQGSRAASAHVLGHHRGRGGPCVHTKEQFTERL